MADFTQASLLCVLLVSILQCTVANNDYFSSGWGRRAHTDHALEWHHPKYDANAAATGSRKVPCTTTNNITINVKQLSDFNLRLAYPNNRLVILNLQADILLSGRSLIFSDSFSCTILKTDKRPRTYWIRGATNDFPVLVIGKAQNIIVYGVNFYIPLNANSSNCPKANVPPADIAMPCAAVWIYQSWGIQINQGIIYGSVQLVSGTYYSKVDGNTFYAATNQHAIVTAYVGVGNYLVPSRIYISNNRFITKDSMVAITMIRQSAGVVVVNNYFENFNFSAVACGTGVSSVGDCVIVTIAGNLIVNRLLKNIPHVSDSTGIYMDTHWVGPGNLLQCNYIIGGQHCLYLDYASSGITVDGMVCINTTDGIKVNTGSRNKVRGVILVNGGRAAALSCQNYMYNNCGIKPGYCWGLKMQALYQSDQIKLKYPWMSNFCAQTSVQLNGVTIPCNAPGDEPASVTGNCSGIPVLNEFQLVGVTAEINTSPFIYASCNQLSAVAKSTVMEYFITAARNARFNKPLHGDYGIADRTSSSITKRFPTFKSCPRSKVGPRVMPFSMYLKMFNKKKPKPSKLPPQPYLFC